MRRRRCVPKRVAARQALGLRSLRHAVPHGVERFSFSDRTGVMELSFYGFYPGQVFECFPIGGCDIVHKPMKTASR